MVKIVLGAIVCIACVGAGLWTRKRYLARAKVFLDWQAFLVGAGEQIGYLLTPLPTIVKDFVAHRPGGLATGLDTGKCPPYLKEVEWGSIRETLDALGSSDLEGQRSRLALAKAHADEWCKVASDEVKSKGNLYAKLCVVGGLAVWLLMA
ncbi:MAG: stage III sporulation protein AB [Clostridia bacterium]|nr:stage III sporulation protein AB [Clostridia bacterium]